MIFSENNGYPRSDSSIRWNLSLGRLAIYAGPSPTMNRIVAYFRDVRAELSKVSWPTRRQTLEYTLIVLGISFVLAIFLGALDFGLGELINFFILR